MNFNEIHFTRGRVYINPVNLTDNYGTELCYIENGVNFMPGLQTMPISREEDGYEIWKVIYLQSRPMITFIAQNYNSDVLKLLFPRSVVEATNMAGSPGDLRSGHILTDDALVTCRLLFVPDNIEIKPCLILQKALPVALNNVNIRLSHNDKMVFSLSFYALRKADSDYGIWYFGKIANGVLV
jgi:hypothetical protein